MVDGRIKLPSFTKATWHLCHPYLWPHPPQDKRHQCRGLTLRHLPFTTTPLQPIFWSHPSFTQSILYQTPTACLVSGLLGSPTPRHNPNSTCFPSPGKAPPTLARFSFGIGGERSIPQLSSSAALICQAARRGMKASCIVFSADSGPLRMYILFDLVRNVLISLLPAGCAVLIKYTANKRTAFAFVRFGSAEAAIRAVQEEVSRFLLY